MPRLLRVLAICVAFSLVFVTHTTRVTAACASGIVSSPQGNFESFDPSTSSDGRYTAFWSAATDLVAGDTNGRYDIFVLDRQTCGIERVSISTGGTQGNNDSMQPSISGDGRYVAFVSSATNLVASDTNNSVDIFVRDRQSSTTIRASVTNAGGQAGSGLGSGRPDISATGQFVAFLSYATNLVAGDTNGTLDVFVRDLVNLTTERVSVATGGTQGINGDSQTDKPSISADGRYVAFASTMTNLVAGDTNDARDIFRHDRQTGTTIRVSVSSAGAQTPNLQDSNSPSISADGRYVAFDSFANGLVPGDTELLYDVFVRDVDSSTTSRISLVNQAGPPEPIPVAQSVSPAMSADGRYVAFSSGAPDLVAGDGNGWQDVFVHDRNTGITRRVSTSFDGIEGDANAAFADISGDGMVVVYSSFSSTFVAGDANFSDDVFVADWRFISAPPNVDLVRNGDFAGGTARWLQFALPDMSHIVSQVAGQVFEFYRVAPPPGTSGQAVVWQNTTAQLLPFAPIVATFDAGNSSTARKRIIALIHDADFTDIQVCTFWLAPGAPMRSYTVRTHTTKAWADATVSFYAATANSDGGFLRVDNATLKYSPGGITDGTDCLDPVVPGPSAGSLSPNLVTNGDFSSGMAFWGLWGQIVSQVTGGVFEFYRPAGLPAGVVLQPTGQSLASGQIFSASLDLANFSSSRKRVTLVIHEGDFSDLAACTFWLEPGATMATYTMRAYASKPWVDATVAVYPSTVGVAPWVQLDNVVLQRLPATSIVGTECRYPGAGPAPARPAQTVSRGGLATGGPTAERTLRPERPFTDQRALRLAPESAPRAAGDATTKTPALRVWVRPSDTPLEIQVSEDGDEWRTIQVVEPADDWRLVTIEVTDVWRRVFVRIIS